MAGKAVAAEGFSLAQFPGARRAFTVVLYSEGFPAQSLSCGVATLFSSYPT
jgi:hypothetical protein